MSQLSAIVQALPTLEAELARRQHYKIRFYFQDAGPFRRELYPKHVACMSAGRTERIRGAIMANRVGKTQMGAFEAVLHLTGRYEEYAPWWTGRRFDTPISMWAAGDTGKTTRDILQLAFYGPMSDRGTGMIPAHLIVHTSAKQGVPDAIEQIWVRHISGGVSTLTLKSYDQRREAFQGTSQHVILMDEEPDEDIYVECVLRTTATSDFHGGIVLVTFTPLKGMTPLVQGLLGKQGTFDDATRARLDGKVFFCDWSEVPHLSDEEKEEQLALIPPNMRDARAKGIPQLGSGAIYPVPETEIGTKDFPPPAHWLRWYALDSAGSGSTAAVFFAWDRDTDTIYVTSVYKRERAEPPVHADAIRARGGDWMEGVGDVAAVATADGVQFLDIYRRNGLKLQLADKAVEAGIIDVWQRLSAGRLKVFASCGPWFEEFRLYRRDEKGRIVKEFDHLMDATRYGVRAPVTVRKVKALHEPTRDDDERFGGSGSSGRGWMS